MSVRIENGGHGREGRGPLAEGQLSALSGTSNTTLKGELGAPGGTGTGMVVELEGADAGARETSHGSIWPQQTTSRAVSLGPCSDSQIPYFYYIHPLQTQFYIL